MEFRFKSFFISTIFLQILISFDLTHGLEFVLSYPKHLEINYYILKHVTLKYNHDFFISSNQHDKNMGWKLLTYSHNKKILIEYKDTPKYTPPHKSISFIYSNSCNKNEIFHTIPFPNLFLRRKIIVALMPKNTVCYDLVFQYSHFIESKLFLMSISEENYHLKIHQIFIYCPFCRFSNLVYSLNSKKDVSLNELLNVSARLNSNFNGCYTLITNYDLALSEDEEKNLNFNSQTRIYRHHHYSSYFGANFYGWTAGLLEKYLNTTVIFIKHANKATTVGLYSNPYNVLIIDLNMVISKDYRNLSKDLYFIYTKRITIRYPKHFLLHTKKKLKNEYDNIDLFFIFRPFDSRIFILSSGSYITFRISLLVAQYKNENFKYIANFIDLLGSITVFIFLSAYECFLSSEVTVPPPIKAASITLKDLINVKKYVILYECNLEENYREYVDLLESLESEGLTKSDLDHGLKCIGKHGDAEFSDKKVLFAKIQDVDTIFIFKKKYLSDGTHHSFYFLLNKVPKSLIYQYFKFGGLQGHDLICRLSSNGILSFLKKRSLIKTELLFKMQNEMDEETKLSAFNISNWRISPTFVIYLVFIGILLFIWTWELIYYYVTRIK